MWEVPQDCINSKCLILSLWQCYSTKWFFGMVDITPFFNLVVYLLSHHSHGGAVVISYESTVDTWNISSFLLFNISTARSGTIFFELPPQLARQSWLFGPSADDFLLLETLHCITLVPTAVTLPVSFPVRLPWPAMQIEISWAFQHWYIN